MARSCTVLGQWHLLVDDFSTSGLDFYTSIEQAVAARQVPGIETSRVEWQEGGVLSAKREYLRITRGRLTFDICAAPFGTSYFFSSWFAEQSLLHALFYACLVIFGMPILFLLSLTMFGILQGFILFMLALVGGVAYLRNAIQSAVAAVEEILLAMPVIGPIYYRLFKPITYYSTDTQIMFQESVHRAMIESIESLRTARGLRALSAAESRPTTRDVLR
jgi:hypothetical protein